MTVTAFARLPDLVFGSLDGRPDADPTEEALTLRLDDDALDRKLAAAEGYPELLSEVRSALERFGRQAFATEALRPLTE